MPLGIATLHSPMGPLVAFAARDVLHGLYFFDQVDLPDRTGMPQDPDRPLLVTLQAELDAYFDGALQHFSIPLATRGTPFQQAVWTRLRDCPRGQSLSYGELAGQIARPQAMRAVGQAVGRNPWIIVVPCHRVLAAGGRLGGFSAGIARKQALLRLEGIPWRA